MRLSSSWDHRECTRVLLRLLGSSRGRPPPHSAAGKTTFYQTHFQPKGYVHVNQDTLKSRDACLSEVRRTVESGTRGCVVGELARRGSM